MCNKIIGCCIRVLSAGGRETRVMRRTRRRRARFIGESRDGGDGGDTCETAACSIRTRARVRLSCARALALRRTAAAATNSVRAGRGWFPSSVKYNGRDAIAII